MSAGAWMPMYWGDYFGDTTALSTEEHGAYLLLIGTYWRRGKPLPDDDSFLASAAKLSRKKWKMVRLNISQYFDVSDGSWKHKRVDNEILKSGNRQQSAMANGRAGGLAKAKLSTTTTTPRKKEQESNPEPQTERIIPATVDSAPAAPKPLRKKPAIPLPEDFPGESQRHFATKFWNDRGRLDLSHNYPDQADQFRDHHLKEGSLQADWPATWRTWARNAIRFNRREPLPQTGAVEKLVEGWRKEAEDGHHQG